ncbi:hypothetical protein A0H76_681 [Hepatospora eriocheir]|uniref:Uncharacterized protein n=1 Tax=Hepatospora eriocheir TaxID=1081669 RepID=A0A1X0QIE0_9MICR|nr:hypothetical protein A0H76_681 [Hepatospora eriocheir]
MFKSIFNKKNERVLIWSIVISIVLIISCIALLYFNNKVNEDHLNGSESSESTPRSLDGSEYSESTPRNSDGSESSESTPRSLDEEDLEEGSIPKTGDDEKLDESIDATSIKNLSEREGEKDTEKSIDVTSPDILSEKRDDENKKDIPKELSE